MKLKITHVLPYGTYDLSFKVYKELYRMVGYTILGGNRLVGLKDFSSIAKSFRVEVCKPVLRHLRDSLDILTECAKLEFKPENVVDFGTSENYVFGENLCIEFEHKTDIYKFLYSNRMDVFLFANTTRKVNFTPCLKNREMHELFLSRHVDIFGLIDTGLAIDINTVKS